MKEKLQRFMIGRYGVDSFSKFLLGVAFAICILDIFIDSAMLSTWFYILVIYSYYRIFSRNIQKRYQENIKFLQIKNKFTSKYEKEISLLTNALLVHKRFESLAEKDAFVSLVQNARQNLPKQANIKKVPINSEPFSLFTALYKFLCCFLHFFLFCSWCFIKPSLMHCLKHIYLNDVFLVENS